MKYTIHINQKAATEHFPDLDIVDLAIFDFIKDFTNSKVCNKMTTDNGTYFMVKWSLIVQQLPILGIKTRVGIYKRIKKLEQANIIIPNPTNQIDRNSWYKWGVNYDLLIFTNTNNVLTDVNSTSNDRLHTTTNDRLHYNNITSNNNINDNKEPTQSEIEIEPTFEQFYELYDKKVDPHLALKAWKKISQKDHEAIMEYIPAYKKAEPKKEFRRNPSVFLNNRTWENEIITKTTAESIVQRGVTASGTESRIRQYHNNGQ